MTNYTFSNELFGDLHKDAYGFRPSEYDWSEWRAMTDDQKQARWDRMIEYMRQVKEIEKAREANSIEVFEKWVARIMARGLTRAEAVKHIDREKNGIGDYEYLAWMLGLPYMYIYKSLK